MEEIQCLLEESHKIQMIHIANCGVTKGLDTLLEASKKKVGLPIRYWNISGNKFTDFKAFITLLECTKNPLYFLDISDCGLTTEDSKNLFKVLTENKNLHEIQQLHIGGCPMDEDSFDSFKSYLRALKKREDTEPSYRIRLQSLNIGLLEEGIDQYMDILTTMEIPLKSLILCASALTQQAADKLIGYLRGASALRVLDLSGTKISAESVADIVSAIGENRNLHHFDLRLNYLYLTSGNLLPIFRVFLSGNLNRWRALSFNGNNMNQDDLRNIIPLLKMMKHLRSISLSDNFDDSMPNIEDILPRLLEIPSLNRVCVAGGEHRLREKIVPMIAKLRDYPNIREVDVGNNSMGDQGMSALINYLRSFKGLTELRIDGSDFKSIDLLATLISVVRDGKHKDLVTMDFPVKDAQSLLKTLSGPAQQDGIRRLADIQCHLVNAISEHRAFQGKPGRLPFDASSEITSLIADISRKSRDDFLENENPLTHTYFCDEIGLPLPFQKIGDLVADGGEVKRIQGFPELEVYETESLYMQVHEDQSHYIPVAPFTASSHFGTSSRLATEEASLLTGTFDRETVEKYHKRRKRSHRRRRTSSKSKQASEPKQETRGKVIMSDSDKESDSEKKPKRSKKVKIAPTRGVSSESSEEIPKRSSKRRQVSDSSDSEPKQVQRRSSKQKKREISSDSSDSEPRQELRGSKKRPNGPRRSDLKRLKQKKVQMSSESSEDEPRQSRRKSATRKVDSSSESDHVKRSKTKKRDLSSESSEGAFKKSSKGRWVSSSSDSEPREAPWRGSKKQIDRLLDSEDLKRSKFKIRDMSSESSEQSPKRSSKQRDSERKQARRDWRVDDSSKRLSKKHELSTESSDEVSRKPKRRNTDSSDSEQIRESVSKKPERSKASFVLHSRQFSDDDDPVMKHESSSSDWESAKRKFLDSSDASKPTRKAASKKQVPKKRRQMSSESSEELPPKKKKSTRRVPESDSSDSLERMIAGLSKKDQRRRDSSSDELPVKKKPIPKPWMNSSD